MKHFALAIWLFLAVGANAQDLGTCKSGEAQAFLNVNNVRAAIYNAGNLFWRGSGAIYTVPQGMGVNAIFAAGHVRWF